MNLHFRMKGVTLDEGMNALEALSKTKDKLTLTPPARGLLSYPVPIASSFSKLRFMKILVIFDLREL